MKNIVLKTFILHFLLTTIISCNTEDKISFTAGEFEVGFNEQGNLSELRDTKNAIDYLHSNTERITILNIQVNGELEQPTSGQYDKEKRQLKLKYPKSGIMAEVEIVKKEGYLTFELVSISDRDKVELVTWGPFETKIGETIGETIGVVRNKDFAIGIQSLNMRTLGGYPTDDDSTPEFDIFGTTSLIDVSDSLKILYRGHTAIPKEYGSSLQAYTRNRTNKRIISNMQHDKYVSPSFKDEGLIGSKIALFGCQTSKVLDIIEKIELEENLPHPILDGVWSKKSPRASSAYLIQDFSITNIDEAISMTKKAGLEYLYHSGPFENWGHFDLKKESFPENWKSMKTVVDKASAQNINVGVHTLSNFITPNDSYVTPIPDERLAKVGSDFLAKSIDINEQNIEIKDPIFFNQMKNNSLHAVVIEDEIIQYESVSESAPWILRKCQRGAFGTTPKAHKQDTQISKLADHAYKTFLTNTELSIEIGERLAKMYNETGLKQISFDGLEGNYSTGMGTYGQLLFTNAWNKGLKPKIKDDYIMDASRSGHFYWHTFTRMNWGEPWYAGFRESQTTYRLLNQDYFRRNYIPGMLGWFSMRPSTSIEDIEWMLARSAAFDAGYALITSTEVINKNGFGSEILEKIKQWEKARMSGSFSVDQKKRMENIKDEFILQTVSDNQWNLIPYSINRFEHKVRVRQPGEPVWSTFSIKNTNTEQPIQFILNTTAGVSVSNIIIEINDFKKIELNLTIKPDQYLKYTGGDEAILYDSTWQELLRVSVNPEKLTIGKGENQIKVDCQFSKEEEASLKLELKTAGMPEKVAKGVEH